LAPRPRSGPARAARRHGELIRGARNVGAGRHDPSTAPPANRKLSARDCVVGHTRTWRCVVEAGCLIGSAASLNRVVIGRGSIVDAGAVAAQGLFRCRLAPWWGVPARSSALHVGHDLDEGGGQTTSATASHHAAACADGRRFALGRGGSPGRSRSSARQLGRGQLREAAEQQPFL